MCEHGDEIHLVDTRDKKRKIYILSRQGEAILACVKKTTYLETGLPLNFFKGENHYALTVGDLPPVEVPLELQPGDLLRLDAAPVPGQGALYDEAGQLLEPAHISVTFPQITRDIKPREPILFDDGKIQGNIEAVHDDHILVRIEHISTRRGRLRADKGINLPESNLSFRGLTDKDKEDLRFVVQHADVVNMSFVNYPEDVQTLFDLLDELGAPESLGIILKIETRHGFNHLADILMTAMQHRNIGLMIARGDLAVEVGWLHIGRVQQELLNICEAAHVPAIWATQVLESMAKRGLPSRAEVTDAVKAQQADAVMLNKGPYILQSIRFLDQILQSMDAYHDKSYRLTPKLKLLKSK